MIKRLSACIREYKKQTILTPVCMVGEVVCECTIPLLTADLINSIQNGCDLRTILLYGLKLFVIAMLSLGFGALSGWFAAEAAAGFAKNLRHDLYYQVQSFSFANIDRFSTSSLVTRLTTDVTNIQNAFMMCIRIAVRAPMMLVFAVIMSIRVGKQLAFIFAGTVPILGLAPKSPTREQQMQPEFISRISIPASFKKPPSIPISPNSFSIRTTCWPFSASPRSFLIRVVFPAPRKPEIMSILVIDLTSLSC